MTQKKKKKEKKGKKKTSSKIQALKGANFAKTRKEQKQGNDIVRLVLHKLVLHLEEERKKKQGKP